MSRLIGWVAVLLVVCGCSDSPYRTLLAPGSVETVVIRDVQVFTGVDATPLPHHDVVLAGGRITAVAPTGVTPPPDARVVEGAGRTLLPGFVDAHVHLTSSGAGPGQDVPVDVEHNLHGWLYAGVTTVFDLGGDAGDLAEWAGKTARGEVFGPRIYHTHIPITVEGSHPIPITKALLGAPISWFVGWVVPTVEALEDVDGVVADVVGEGVDYVKITVDQMPPGSPEMSDELLAATVKATTKHGKRAVVHIGDGHKGRVAAEAGAGLLAHLPWRTSVSDDDARAIGATGIAMTATLTGWHGLAALADGTWAPTPLDREINPPALFAPVDREAVEGAVEATMEAVVAARPSWAGAVKRLYDAGVVMLVGTDSPLPGVYVGGSYHEEMRRLVECGVPPAEVLLGATGRAARWIEAAPEYGTVEVGKVADLVLVDGDPLAEIGATTAIVEVWRAGRPVGRRVE